METAFEERKPEWLGISVLALQLRQINRPSVDPWRCTCLEAVGEKSELLELCRDLGGWCLASSAGRDLRGQAHMDSTT
jgi:hypothetical protein